MEDNKESAKPPVMTWKKDSEDYQEFLQLRTAENLENRKNTENKKRKPYNCKNSWITEALR